MARSGLTGRFFGNLDVRYLDGNRWQLLQQPGKPFGLEVDTCPGESPFDIRPIAGFVFDFASIPRPFRWIYPKVGGGKSGKYGPAATIHDWLYTYPGAFSRKFCDRVFLLGMELTGVRPTMRSLFYRAVRLGGCRYFGKPDKLNRLRGV